MSRFSSGDDLFRDHYQVIREYLSSYMQTLGLSQRSKTSAKDKLSKLPQEEFLKVSSDVYDEIKRRMYDSKTVPFLPIRNDLLPKRNQARQKMATLSLTRFQELSCEVMLEIEKRFPMLFEENDQSPEISQNNDRNYESIRQYSNDVRGKSSERRPDDRLRRPDIRDRRPSDVSISSSAYRSTPSEAYSVGEIDKIKSEYNSKIAKLELQLRDFEKNLRESDQIIHDLEKNLETQTRLNAELQKKNDSLKHDRDSLKDDYNHQKDITESLRSEASNFLAEIKTLTARNKELEERLRSSQNEQKFARDSSGPSVKTLRLDAFYASIDDLSAAARGGQSTAVLVAMKAVLLSCKSITEESELIEQADVLNESDKVRLHSGKEALSSALAHLLEIAKDHASGRASLDGLDGAIDRLTQSLNDLVNIMKRYDHNNGKDAPLSKWASPPDSPRNVSSFSKDSNVRGMDLVELKLFLEEETDEIAHTIQDLLQTMRSSSASGHELAKYISVICEHIDTVMYETRGTFKRHGDRDISEKALDIASDLSDTKNLMNSLGSKIGNDPSNKSLKQKIANTSYEIAKHAKDLLGLLE